MILELPKSTLFDFQQNFLRQFNFTQVHKCTQVPSENESTRTFSSVFVHAKTGRIKTSRCSATVQKTRVFCDQGAQTMYYRHDSMEWVTISMPLREELDTYECRKIFWNLDITDSVELTQYIYKGSFTNFDRLFFQNATEKKQTPLNKKFEHCTYCCIHLST